MYDCEMSIMSPVCTIRSAPKAFVCLTIFRIFSSDMWMPACTSERCAMRSPFRAGGRSGKISVRRVIDGSRSALQIPYAENPTQIQADQATENPAQKLPRDPRRDVGNAADPPQAAGEHAHGNDAPGDVENDKDEGEPAARRERQALAQVEV